MNMNMNMPPVAETLFILLDIFSLGGERPKKVLNKVFVKFTISLLRSDLIDLIIRFFRLNQLARLFNNFDLRYFIVGKWNSLFAPLLPQWFLI